MSNKATLIGSISILLWGMLALLTTLTGGAIPPFQLMAMSFLIAFVLMVVRSALQGRGMFKSLRQTWQVWALGVGGYYAYHYFYFTAMQQAPAVEVSLIAYLWPLLIVLFSSFLPGGELRLQHVSGALISLWGCWLLIGGGKSGFNWDFANGYLFAFLCALVWSSYSVLSRLVKQVSTDVVTWFCLFSGLLAVISHYHWEETVWPQGFLQWGGVIGLGVGPLGIAFFTWDYGVKHGDIQLLGVLSYMAPLISALLLVMFGMAELTDLTVMACLATVVGSAVAGISMRKAH